MQNNPFANVKLRKTTQPVERGLANFAPEPTQPHIPPPPPGSQPNTSNVVTSQPTSSGHVPLPPSGRSPIQQQHVPTSSSVFSTSNIPLPPGGQPVKYSMPVSNNSVSSYNSNSAYCPPPPNMQKTKVPSSSPLSTTTSVRSHIPQPPGSVSQNLDCDDELEKLLAELKTSTSENVPLPTSSQPSKPVSNPVSSFPKRGFVPPIPNAKTEPKALEFYQQLCDSVKEKKTGLEFKDIPKCTYQFKKYNSVGASDIDISVDQTKLNQIVKPSQMENDDGVAFCFIVSFTLQNTQKHPVVLNHCELQYQDSNGKWIRSKSNYLCSGEYWNNKDTINSFIFGGKEWGDFSVKCVFPHIPNISATTLHKYEFVSHPTLPQPLQLKIVIGDKFGETKELQIEQFNFIPQIPQDAYTKIIEKSYMEPLARYVFCEDLNSHNHICQNYTTAKL